MISSATPPRIFSRSRRIAGFKRALSRQNRDGVARYIIEDMVEDVLERLEFMRLSPKRVLVIGDWTNTLALSLRSNGAEVIEHDVRSLDEEAPLPDGAFDLAVSLSSLDRVNDLPGALLHIRNALTADGLMIASMIGAGSLQNLRKAMIAAEPDRAAPRMHPLVDNLAATGLLNRALFKRQVVDSHGLTVAYRSFDKLVQDLRDQNLGNALTNPAPPLGKRALGRARDAFSATADRDGRTLETFEILTLTAWKS